MLQKPTHSFFLFGPRGTGKSTWVKAQFKDAVYIDLLDSSVWSALQGYPDRLSRYIPVGFDGWIVIDEVQRIPELLNEVHRLIESRRLCFALTGSSARKLRRKGTNLLAGRALTKYMHPLVASELKGDFELSRALTSGLLPMGYLSDGPDEFLQSYVRTYLEQEILQEGLTRNIGTFSRFLEAASFSQGNVLNISAVARECGVGRKLAENYFAILEDLLIGRRLNAFSKRASRRVVQHPKFYLFDVGVFRTIRPKGPLDIPAEIEGAALETLIFQTLSAAIDYMRTGYSLFYWRTATGLEVDFVLYGEPGIIAIEVKRTSRLRSADFKGLKAFLADYPMARGIMLYGGDREMTHNDVIRIIPIDTFCRRLPEYI